MASRGAVSKDEACLSGRILPTGSGLAPSDRLFCGQARRHGATAGRGA
ncbi:MAG: hypothetical protein FWF59_09640 [Turicibacter sp.]|nr:hypothetical protein [Turicibacter sp.]